MTTDWYLRCVECKDEGADSIYPEKLQKAIQSWPDVVKLEEQHENCYVSIDGIMEASAFREFMYAHQECQDIEIISAYGDIYRP